MADKREQAHTEHMKSGQHLAIHDQCCCWNVGYDAAEAYYAPELNRRVGDSQKAADWQARAEAAEAQVLALRGALAGLQHHHASHPWNYDCRYEQYDTVARVLADTEAAAKATQARLIDERLKKAKK